jgi:hypothetical protein
MEDQFNRKHGAKFRSFDIGQLVFTRRHNSADWHPGKIIDKKGVIYTVELPNNSRSRFHANQIRTRQIPDDDFEEPIDVINGRHLWPPNTIKGSKCGRNSAGQSITASPPISDPKSPAR